MVLTLLAAAKILVFETAAGILPHKPSEAVASFTDCFSEKDNVLASSICDFYTPFLKKRTNYLLEVGKNTD